MRRKLYVLLIILLVICSLFSICQLNLVKKSISNIEYWNGNSDFSPNLVGDYVLEHLQTTYSWNPGYQYGGQQNYSGLTGDYKYLILEYTGNLSAIRLELTNKGVVWFKQSESEGMFKTVDGALVPAIGNSTRVVIDLEASGVEASNFSSFHVHTGDDTASSVTITKAWLSTTIPDINSSSFKPVIADKVLDSTNLSVVYDASTDKGLQREFSWSGGYQYGGHAVYSGITNDYKYLALEYTGNISSLRIEMNNGNDFRWFSEHEQGSFKTVKNEIVPAVGNSTRVVIDLEKSGIPATHLSDFYIHIGDDTTSSLNITKAFLSTTVPDVIEGARRNALDDINYLKKTTTNETILELLDNLLEQVTFATTQEELNQVLDLIPTTEDIKLQEEKDSAIAEINTYENEENSNDIVKLLEDAITDINSATTIAEVNRVKELYISNIILQQAREDAYLEIKVLEADNNSDEVNDIINEAYEKIEAETDINKIGQIVVDYKLNVYKQKQIEVALQYIKLNSSNKIKDLVNGAIEEIQSRDTTTIEMVDTIINRLDMEVGLQLYKENAILQIENYKSDNNSLELNQIIQEAILAIDSQTDTLDIQNKLTYYLDAIRLQLSKDNALREINKYKKDDNSSKVKELISEAEELIFVQNDQLEIERIVLEYIEKIKLQVAKDNAIKDLTEFVDKKYSDKIKVIYERAKENINNANTEEEIKDILTKAQNSITKQLNKETIVNPLTLDNIFIYVLVFILTIFAIISIVVFKRKRPDNC